MCNQLTWTETAHCRSGVHCRTCRDREGGRPWRAMMARAFVVSSLDWACPQGKAWGYRPPDRGLGDTVERVLDWTGIGPVAKKVIRKVTGRPCRCAKRREQLNRLAPYGVIQPPKRRITNAGPRPHPNP